MLVHHLMTVRVKLAMSKESEDSFVVTCPQIGCIFVHEETEESAYRSAREAIEAYVRMSLQHDDPIPDEIVIRHEVNELEQPLLLPPPSPATLELTRDIAVAV